MLKLIDTFIILCGWIIVAVICIVTYMLTPDTFSGFTSLKWPQQPSTISQEIPWQENTSKAYADENLLIEAEGLSIVKRHCTGCHSERLITQNRMNRERWASNIIWMQETQGLWDLGADLNPVLGYLSTHYAPISSGRRPNLTIQETEWYRLQ